MRIRFLTGVAGLLLVEAGFYFVYRPLCPIFVGALLLFVAARGGKK